MRRRVLFSAAGGHGHLQPLLPLAAEAAGAGHEVLVTGAASLGEHVTARGLAFLASGPDLQPIHAPLVVRDLDAERQAVADHFVARLGRVRVTAVRDLCRSWRPDVVVRDEVDFGAAVAAEAAGLPHVAIIVIGAGSFIIPARIDGPLRTLSSELGLRNGTGPALLHRHLTLTPFPASFRDPSDPLPGRVLAYTVPPTPRTHPCTSTAGATVFVTLGTIFNTESGGLLRTAALGAANCAAVGEVIVATGEHLDPASLGPLPLHVAVHRFVDQDAALARCDAVVSHAGSGTVLGALKYGLPTVNLPLGADQQLNAHRLQDLGLGLSLKADATDAEQVSSALTNVLASVETARRLQAVRDEILASAGPADAVKAVTALVP